VQNLIRVYYEHGGGDIKEMFVHTRSPHNLVCGPSLIRDNKSNWICVPTWQ